MATGVEYPTKQQDDFFTIVGNAFQLIQKSWAAVRLNLTTFILVYLAPLIFIALGFLVAWPLFARGDGITIGAGLLVVLIALAGLAVLLITLAIATIIVQLSSVRGKKISFSEAVNQSLPYFWHMVGLGILSAILIGAGLILLIIPGLLVLFLLSLSSYVLIDQKIGVIDSMKASYELVKANWKVVLALMLVQFVIGLPSFIPVIGSIITIALTIAYFCLPAIIYLRVAGKSKDIAEITA